MKQAIKTALGVLGLLAACVASQYLDEYSEAHYALRATHITTAWSQE